MVVTMTRWPAELDALTTEPFAAKVCQPALTATQSSGNLSTLPVSGGKIEWSCGVGSKDLPEND